MMTTKLIQKPWFALLVFAWFCPSCIPVDDFDQQEPKSTKTDPQVEKPAEPETREQIAARKKAELEKKKAEESRRKEEQKSEMTKPPVVTEKKDPPPPPPVERPKKTYPVAIAVPGKPGFVYSPYNNKVLDVKGVPSGELVNDPYYPESEKMHFRVP